MHDDSAAGSVERYRESLASERRIYEDCADVHDLPEIFHYWSERHLRRKLNPFGFGSANEMFKVFLERQYRRGGNETRHFVSIGSGNCDLEVQIAGQLVAARCGDFVIDCLDLNPAMLDRGRRAAEAAGLSRHLAFIETDLNSWSAARGYDAVMANQSLHHMVNLEGLFAEVKRSLLPGGRFIISDMIGRNGHVRWPEALEIVHEYWRKLPPSYRVNRRTGVYEELFEDWDCSVEGFEGVRSQDILPLLERSFHFELFLPFGNVIDPFVDRTFGPNFRAAAEWDRNFVDQVHVRDELEIGTGRIKPTHMLAVATLEQQETPLLFSSALTPAACIRDPLAVHRSNPPTDPYEWRDWPRDVRQELARTTQRLHLANSEIVRLNEKAASLEKELAVRTTWALGLDRDLEVRAKQVAELERELESRTIWALRLKKELEAKMAGQADVPSPR